jgi:hypothetical protein
VDWCNRVIRLLLKLREWSELVSSKADFSTWQMLLSFNFKENKSRNLVSKSKPIIKNDNLNFFHAIMCFPMAKPVNNGVP